MPLARNSNFTNQDRSFHFHLRVWKESWWKPWTPQVVLGANDAISDSANGGSLSNQQNQDYGNGFWNRYYLAVTKHIDFEDVGTLCLGYTATVSITS